MKLWKLIPILFALSMVSCTKDPAPGDPPADESTTSETEPKDEDMVGLSQEAAEALAKERGLKSRVVSVDGDVRPVTMDYLQDRVNFTIEKGKVVKVNRG
ncbi:MAG: hypothetical protein AAGF67_03385 [Verrucomicrobiota bacterium]